MGSRTIKPDNGSVTFRIRISYGVWVEYFSGLPGVWCQKGWFMIPDDLLYTAEHLWVRAEGRLITVGLTEYAQQALGEVAYVELPQHGTLLKAGQEACAIESWKAAAGIDSPIDAVVTEANATLSGSPTLINRDCYGEGWIFRAELADSADLSGLLQPEQYAQHLAGQN